jgi:uncharacterized protein with PIN domain
MDEKVTFDRSLFREFLLLLLQKGIFKGYVEDIVMRCILGEISEEKALKDITLFMHYEREEKDYFYEEKNDGYFHEDDEDNDLVYGWKACPRRGAEYKDDVEFCPECGWEFHNKSCPRCGEYMSNDAKICPNCGWYFYWKDYIGEDD